MAANGDQCASAYALREQEGIRRERYAKSED